MALRLFCEIWKAHYGVSYYPSPVDCGLLKALVTRIGEAGMAELRSVFERYLEDASPFVAQEQRHGLKWFCTSGGFNKYRVTAPVLSAKEARGVEAGRQFVNGDNHERGR